MAKRPSRNIRTYLDQYALGSFLTGADLQLDQETPVVTALADDGPRRLAANYDHKHKLMGLFDAADFSGTDSFDEVIHALLGSETHYLAQAYESATEGTVVYESIVALMGEPRSGSSGGAILLGVDLDGSNALSRSTVLRSATLSGVGNGTGQNLGATTLGQTLQAVFRVLSFTGTNITLTVEQSTDDGSVDPYAAIAGMTSGALTGVGAVRTTTTAATEAWKRVAATGTFTSALVLVTIGRVAGA